MWMSAAYMKPPLVTVERLSDIEKRYPKGTPLKVRITRNGVDVTDMTVDQEEYHFQEINDTLEALKRMQEIDDKLQDELWNSEAIWSKETYSGEVKVVYDQSVTVCILGFRDVRISANDLPTCMSYKDPASNVPKPKRDAVTVGMAVEGLRLRVDNRGKVHGTMLKDV